MKNVMEYGPTRAESLITSSIDYYKFTMSQFFFENLPEEQVTFRDTNRSEVLFSEHIDAAELQARLDFIQERGFSEDELNYLASVKAGDDEFVFTNAYLEYLAEAELPRPVVSINEKGDIAVEVAGDSPTVTFWETVILAEKNELYFKGLFADDLAGLQQAFAEGDARLTEKIQRLKEYNESLPETVAPLTFAEFGTRRRFSGRWQEHVVKRLAAEVPEIMVGTSNVGLAETNELPPIGTFAHELMMVYAAVKGAEGNDDGLRYAQQEVLEKWAQRYPYYTIALSDTFTSEVFFEDFAKADPVGEWIGTRHDSGDPFEYAERTIRHYEEIGADPTTKKILFSDGLDVEKMIQLHRVTAGAGRIGSSNGIGTNLTNDLGVKVPSQVMKAVEVNSEETCKISDNSKKATGSPETRERYFRVFNVITEKMVEQVC